MRRGAGMALAILFVAVLSWAGIGGADLIPPELTIPPDVTIECHESTDPSNTGQATAIDESDPSPVVTYVDAPGYGANAWILRTWTATDASGNTSAGEQVITVLPPDVTILGVSPESTTTLPCTFTISFKVDGCATHASAYLQAQTYHQTNDYFSDSPVAIEADGTTVNTVDVTIPTGADDDIYRLAQLWLEQGSLTHAIVGPRDFVTVAAGTTVPELTLVEISAPMSYFPQYAREDELIRIEFRSTIPLANTPVVTILGRSAVVTNTWNNTEWKAELLLLASDPEGVADFTIDYESLSGVPGDQVTETTNGSWVMYDQTPPSTPVLIEPADGATETHGWVSFRCEESTDAGSGIWRYHWYDSHGNEQECSQSLAREYTADDTFTWWMKAEDYAGNYSDPAPARTLSIYLTPELIITETGGSTDVAEGVPGVDLVKVQFNRDPGADVDVIVTPDAQLDVGEGAGTSYTFHYIDGVDAWTRQFEIETGAVDDVSYEQAHTGLLQIVTSCSGNPNFDGLSASVTVNITDNDPPSGLAVVESSGSTELQETKYEDWWDSFTVVLDTEPADDVTVTVDPDDQSFVDGYNAGEAVDLTFTPGDWDTPQEVVVIASDDDIIEGDHTSTIELSTHSLDVGYQGLIETVIANITDYDTGTTLIDVPDPFDISMTEGESETWTYQLTAQPTADVDVVLQVNPQLELEGVRGGTVTLTFTTTNYKTPQAFLIGAYDDLIVEGPHHGILTIEHVTACPHYTADPFEVIIAIHDNDAPLSVSGSGPAGELLDLALDLAEGEEPPMIGTLPLSAIYVIGDPVTGAIAILDGEGIPLTDSRIFVYLYLVTIDGLNETRTEVASVVVTCDRTTGEYCFHLETTGLEPGIYDIYLGFEDGSSQILRVELQAPPS